MSAHRKLSSATCGQLFAFATAVLMLGVATQTTMAQPDAMPTVKIDLGPQVELQVLIDYVSKRFGISILFDERVVGQQVTLNAPNEVPVDSLLPLLQTALKMKGFALVDVDVPGWKQIITTEELTSAVPFSDDLQVLQQQRATDSVTQVFQLKHVDSSYASQLIQPYLSSSEFDRPRENATARTAGADSVSSLSQQIAGAQARAAAGSDLTGRVSTPRRDILIVTDFAFNIRRVASILSTLDAPLQPLTTKSVEVQHQPLANVMERLNEVMKSDVASQLSRIQIATDEAHSQIVVRGPDESVQQAIALIRELDTKPTALTKIYTLKHYSTARLKELLGQIMTDKVTMSLADDAQSNRLFVYADSRIQNQVAKIVDLVDKQPTKAQKRLQTYQLQNLTAAELLSTLRTLQGNDGGQVTNEVSESPREQRVPGSRTPRVTSPARPAARSPGETGASPANRAS